MRLLEFEAKKILRDQGITVPKGHLINKGDRFEINRPVMLKAQVPVGGRAKANAVPGATNSNSLKGGSFRVCPKGRRHRQY